jgi:hypothetical protein
MLIKMYCALSIGVLQIGQIDFSLNQKLPKSRKLKMKDKLKYSKTT